MQRQRHGGQKKKRWMVKGEWRTDVMVRVQDEVNNPGRNENSGTGESVRNEMI